MKRVSKGIETTWIRASSASMLPPTERLQKVNEQFNVHSDTMAHDL